MDLPKERFNRELLLKFHEDFCERALGTFGYDELILLTAARRKAGIGLMTVETKLLDGIENRFAALGRSVEALVGDENWPTNVKANKVEGVITDNRKLNSFLKDAMALINVTVLFHTYAKLKGAKGGYDDNPEYEPIMDEETMKQGHLFICNQGREIMRLKNHDYAGGRSGHTPFANFTRTQVLGITDTEIGFQVRMSDKLSRLITFVEGNKLQVKDESVLDSCVDLCNYTILLVAYLLDCIVRGGMEMEALAGQL